MKREDKFGRRIFSDKVWQKMLNYGRILNSLGYVESKRKPNLFYRNTGEIVFFADMRGSEYFPIWRYPNPLFYFRVLDDQMPEWKINRLKMAELKRLKRAGANPERAMEDLDGPWLGDEWYEDGYCKVCGKDFQSDGYFCSDECKERWQLNEMLKELNSRPRCHVCGMPINPGDEVSHHVSYKDDAVVLVHRGCHIKIHRTNSHPDLKPSKEDVEQHKNKKRKKDQIEPPAYVPPEPCVLLQEPDKRAPLERRLPKEFLSAFRLSSLRHLRPLRGQDKQREAESS